MQILIVSLLIVFYQNCSRLDSAGSFDVSLHSSQLLNGTTNDEPDLTEDLQATDLAQPTNIREESSKNITVEEVGKNKDEVIENIKEASLLNCNNILKESNNIFLWSDLGKTNETIYDFWLGSSPNSKDIYNHKGKNEFKGSEIKIDDLPTDGRLVYQTLKIFRDGPESEPLTVSCQSTTVSIKQEAIEDKHVHKLIIPEYKVSEGKFDKALWEKITSFKFNFAVNQNLKSVINYNEKWWIQLRHKPSSRGTERVIMSSDLPRSRRGYKVTQTFLFKPGWESGATKKSGKLGFGLGGGSAQSGGKTGTDGWTVRPSWTKEQFSMYLYYANRPYLVQGRDPAYGHLISSGYAFKAGVEYKLTYEVILNSPGKRDGSFYASINGKNVISLKNIIWMTGDEPEVDKLWVSSFHGGSTTEWRPTKNVYLLVRDVYLEKL